MRKWVKNLNKTAALGGVVLATALMAFFQNCAPHTVPIAIYTSPFDEARVRIDSSAVQTNNTSEKATVSEQGHLPEGAILNLIVDNACAKVQCQSNPESSVSCPLYHAGNRLELENSNQGYEWILPKAMSIDAIDDLLKSNQADNLCVKGVSQSQLYQAQSGIPDPNFTKQYYHDVINGTSTYDFYDNANLAPVTVAIIDTGIDMTREYTYAPGDIVKVGGHPDITLSSDSAESSNFSHSCPSSICYFHGTFVAGIIAANANNGLGGRGIAQNVKLISYQIGDAEGKFSTTELYNALSSLVYRVDAEDRDPVDIVNMSIGGNTGTDYSYADVLMKIINKNVLVVAAAGNNASNLNLSPVYPASFHFDSQINVGSASPEVVEPGSTVPY